MQAGPVQKPTVAFLLPALLLGGAERQLFQLASALRARGLRILILTFSESDQSFYSGEPAGQISIRRIPKGRNLIAFVRRLRATLENERVDVLHAYLTSAQAYALLARISGWKGALVFGVRDSLPLFYHKDFKNVLGEVLVFNPVIAADRYVFNSFAGLSRKQRALRTGRSLIIENFVDTDRFRPKEDTSAFRSLIAASNDDVVVGIVANVTRYKDYPTFITAAGQVLDKCAGVRFVAVGSNVDALGVEAKNLVARIGISDRFSFLGARADVHQLLPAFDILCSSSLTEGLSNVICEAMACGVPCVVTDVGDSARIVGDCGRVVPPKDPKKLADAILELIHLGRPGRRYLGLAGRSRALGMFSSQTAVSQHLALYESLWRQLQTRAQKKR